MSNFWYALHVKPRFEKCVTTQLEQKGFETLLPTYTSKRQWSDRVKTLTLPMFPGYLFCRFDVHSRFPIVVTPGVMAILGPGRVPAPVEESEIASIRHVMASGAHAEPCPYIPVGELVRVECGPLEGLTGIVLRTKGSERLVVSVSLLQRSVSVELDRTSVVPLPRVPQKHRAEAVEMLQSARPIC
jgi:transcription antitermination factor NusG